MADQPTGRTFTEGEAYALVDDNVKRETAALKAQVEETASQKAALESKVDVLETEKAALTTRAEKAEQDLADYKTQVDNEKASEAKRGERSAKVTEINAKLLEGEDGTARLDRIVAMSDENFEAYLGDMRQAASLAAKPGEKPAAPAAPAAGEKLPNETAAFGGTGATDTNDDKPSGVGVIDLFGARRAPAV